MNSEWKQKVIQSFDDCAHQYDDYSDIQGDIAHNLANHLPELYMPDVLEIGCGTGKLTRHILDTYNDGKFHITDISPQMLTCARTNIGAADGIEWGVMDGENPAMDRRYDLIIGNMVFQWFENTDKAFELIRSLLKPGGYLFYTVPAPGCFKEWRSILSELSLQSGILGFEMLPGVFMEEETVVNYKTTLRFLQSIKQLGAHTSRRGGYTKLNHADLRKACKRADEQFQGKITWNILYGCIRG